MVTPRSRKVAPCEYGIFKTAGVPSRRVRCVLAAFHFQPAAFAVATGASTAVMRTTAKTRDTILFIAYSFLESMQNMQNSFRVPFGEIHFPPI
jgi:hypothetical protein